MPRLIWKAGHLFLVEMPGSDAVQDVRSRSNTCPGTCATQRQAEGPRHLAGTGGISAPAGSGFQVEFNWHLATRELTEVMNQNCAAKSRFRLGFCWAKWSRSTSTNGWPRTVHLSLPASGWLVRERSSRPFLTCFQPTLAQRPVRGSRRLLVFV